MASWKQHLRLEFDFDIGIYPGAGAFVCGESTALMYSLEGKRGMPAIKPPRSTEAGLWSQPTVLNNVETFANVPAIIRNGAKWFAENWNQGSKGNKGLCFGRLGEKCRLSRSPHGDHSPDDRL